MPFGLIVSIGLLIAMIIKRHETPTNYWLLAAWTLVEAYTVSVISKLCNEFVRFYLIFSNILRCRCCDWSVTVDNGSCCCIVHLQFSNDARLFSDGRITFQHTMGPSHCWHSSGKSQIGVYFELIYFSYNTHFLDVSNESGIGIYDRCRWRCTIFDIHRCRLASTHA